MLNPKPMNPSSSFILDLDGRIGHAHQTLSQQIDAVPDMWWRDHRWRISV